jgi:hypothetical protein
MINHHIQGGCVGKRVGKCMDYNCLKRERGEEMEERESRDERKNKGIHRQDKLDIYIYTDTQK